MFSIKKEPKKELTTEKTERLKNKCTARRIKKGMILQGGVLSFPYLIGGNCADYWIENNTRLGSLYVKEGTNIRFLFQVKKSILLIMMCVLYTNFNGWPIDKIAG
jgi:hypothetical protein